MLGRHRNLNEWRGYNSNYRNYNRGGGESFGRKSYIPPPPPRPHHKEEILKETGRLAAEYLVYKGLLPPESLPPKWQNRKFQDFKGQDRDSPVPDGQNLSFNRHGNSNANVGNGSRRYNDEYNEGMGPRNDFRGNRRMGDYSREFAPERGRGNRGYNNMKDEDDFAHEYYRERQSGFDHLPSRSENTVESGSENHISEDTGSKASSSGVRKAGDANKDIVDDANVVNLEGGDEVKSDASDNQKQKNLEELDVNRCEIEGESKSGDDSMKLCSSAREPTEPQLSVDQKSPKTQQGITTGASNTVEDSSGEPMVTLGEVRNNSLPNQTDIKRRAFETLNNLSVQPVVESIEKQDEAGGNDERAGVKRQRDLSMEDKLSQMRNVRGKQSNPEVEKPLVEEEKVTQAELVGGVPMDEEIVGAGAIDQEKVEVEPEINDKKEEEKELRPASFKTCDLNLMQRPEVTEIHDDPDPDHHHTSLRRLETGNELSMDFSLSIGNNSNGADDFGRISGDDKVVQVIDLESDSAIDANASDPSKPKDEPMYPNLDAFLNQPEHGDLPGLNDGYSLAFSEFLPPDLNNLQTGMGLHDAEGVPNDDDSIYVSLGEIPIGFMGVWDQPPQEYGKFF